MDKSETFCPGNWVTCIQSYGVVECGQIVRVCPDASIHVAPGDFYGIALEHVKYPRFPATLFMKCSFRAANAEEIAKVGIECADIFLDKMRITSRRFEHEKDYMEKVEGAPPTPQAQDILDEARSIVTGARRQTHGEAERSFEKIARGWSEILGIEVAPFKVALCMDWLKTVRAVDGDSTQRDHFVDKCGYSALAAELALSVRKG